MKSHSPHPAHHQRLPRSHRNFPAFLTALAGCALISIASPLQAEDKAETKAGPAAVEAKQGITGRVVRMKGNFMPQVGTPAAPQLPRRTVTPISVPVHVFKGSLAPMKKPDPKHPALIEITRSDKDGVYRIPLEPGVYTVVVEIDGKLYLNSYEANAKGAEFWTPRTVKKGEWLTVDINDSSHAAF